MRPCLLALLALTCCNYAFSATLTVIDPFAQPSCPAGVVTGCDAVGSTQQADFYRGDFNFGPTSGTINLYFNYGPPGGVNLSPYAATANTVIGVADLFLSDDTDTYAFPLFNRTTANWGSATAGSVYLANSAAALLNSETVLNNPSDIDYRSGYPVWINTQQATLVSVGSINVSQNQVIDGNTVGFAVTWNLSYADGSAFANFLNNPNLSVFTATTTAAQDLVPDAEVPEPATGLLAAIGAGLVWAFRRRATNLSIR